MKKNSFRCAVCKKTVNDVYDSPMLRDSIWKRISSEHFDKRGKWVSQMICLECMEAKLGRKIKESDLMMWEGIIPSHVYWNKKFLNEHLPNHKWQVWP